MFSHTHIHTSGVFYYIIGNVRPELRSTQRAIQLVACVKSKYIKTYGFKRVLDPFIDDIKILLKVRKRVTSLGKLK